MTLESVAALAGANAVVAILTGMGNDGARGVMAIQENGGLVIAQDEVYLGNFRHACRGHQDRRGGATFCRCSRLQPLSPAGPPLIQAWRGRRSMYDSAGIQMHGPQTAWRMR